MTTEIDFAALAASHRRAAARTLLEAAPQRKPTKFPDVTFDDESLFANTPVAVFRYRGTFERGRVEFISASIEEITGRTPAEICTTVVENMLLPWLTPHPDYAADYVAYLKNLYAPDKTMRAVNRGTAKDGTQRWFMLVAKPVEEFPDGEFALHGAVLDITDTYEQLRRQVGEQKPAQSLTDDGLSGNERVMIVAGDMAAADDLSAALTDLGYETAPVYCPFEAAAVMEQAPDAWDVVVADHEIGGVAGIALIAAIRAIRPDILAILCTDLAISEIDEIISTGKADACLRRPADSPAVAASIRRLRALTVRRN